MEIREFCEQLLFGQTLEDKLLRPERLLDQAPGKGLPVCAAPGRPVGLEIAPSGVREVFPSVRALEREEGQGQALHAFANHELMAIELMALALLRFPEAPAGYRRGLAAIILEEQTHFSLYLEEAKRCGVEFGEFPLSGFFWGALNGMLSAAEATAGLGLTLEQANLDFSAHYAKVFRKVGAVRGAEILETVLEDEIGHVAHGVRWMREWAAPGEDILDAQARVLRLPLSLARAKAFDMVGEPRRRAGLSDEYVRRLREFRGSKGRPPVVHTFNPRCEEDVCAYRLGGKRSQEQGPRVLDHLAEDLETVPALWARTDDLVWVKRLPSDEFVTELGRAGLAWPRFVTALPGPEEHPHYGDVRPWGWSPSVRERLSPAFEQLVSRPRFFERPWSLELSDMYRKSFGLSIAAEFARSQPGSGLLPAEALGVSVADVGDLVAAVEGCFGRGFGEVVLKADFGTSGRNAIRVRAGGPDGGLGAQLSPAELAWAESTLSAHGGVVVEPWLKRICDVSLTFTVAAGGSVNGKRLGAFLADRRGQYLGGFVGGFASTLPPEVARFVSGEGRDRQRIQRVMGDVALAVAARLHARGYLGPAGVDAFVYLDTDGQLRLKPIVEVNPRTTMGHVCAALTAAVAKPGVGAWLILGAPDVRGAGFPSLSEYAQDFKQRHPLALRNGKIKSGAVFTTDPSRAKSFLTALLVAEDRALLCEMLPPRARAASVV